MGRLGDLFASRLVRWVIVIAVVAAGVGIGTAVASSSNTYPLNVVFAKAPGLFPGAAVQIDGVQVGTVVSVTNVADQVNVGMKVGNGHPIPTSVIASLVSPQLLGEPNIELDPGYTGGPRLAQNATIPESRTSVPISTDQLLKSLEKTLNQLNPKAVGDLVSNLASDLNGQGQNLNQLISGAAGTLKILAAKGNELGSLNGSLAQLTGSLDSQTTQITQLISDYDVVSGVFAQHSAQLNDAIGQLSSATTDLVTLLTPNLTPLESDVGTVATVGRTLDRNISSIDGILQSALNLFTAAQKAYDPNYNWLNLNLALAPGVTGAYVAGLIRDRLSGICRRIFANHSSGLSATELATLEACGNPASGFFDPIIGSIGPLLNTLTGGTASSGAVTTPAQMIQKGLAEIPGLNQATQGTTAPTTPSATTPPSSTTTQPPSSSNPCSNILDLLSCLLGQQPQGAKSNSVTSSGLDGVLSSSVSDNAASAPSLTPASYSLLPGAKQGVSTWHASVPHLHRLTWRLV